MRPVRRSALDVEAIATYTCRGRAACAASALNQAHFAVDGCLDQLAEKVGIDSRPCWTSTRNAVDVGDTFRRARLEKSIGLKLVACRTLTSSVGPLPRRVTKAAPSSNFRYLWLLSATARRVGHDRAGRRANNGTISRATTRYLRDGPGLASVRRPVRGRGDRPTS